MALHAGDIGIPIGRTTGALAFPQHLSQAFHRVVVRAVQGIALVREQLHRLADAARLVNRALLADGQMHGQVQKRVGAALAAVIDRRHGRIGIAQVGVVFGMLVNPQACYGFNSF